MEGEFKSEDVTWHFYLIFARFEWFVKTFHQIFHFAWRHWQPTFLDLIHKHNFADLPFSFSAHIFFSFHPKHQFSLFFGLFISEIWIFISSGGSVTIYVWLNMSSRLRKWMRKWRFYAVLSRQVSYFKVTLRLFYKVFYMKLVNIFLRFYIWNFIFRIHERCCKDIYGL